MKSIIHYKKQKYYLFTVLFGIVTGFYLRDEFNYPSFKKIKDLESEYLKTLINN